MKAIVANPIIIVSSRPLVIRLMLGILLTTLGLEVNFICARKAPQNATKPISIINKACANASGYLAVNGEKRDIRVIPTSMTILATILPQLILIFINLRMLFTNYTTKKGAPKSTREAQT